MKGASIAAVYIISIITRNPTVRITPKHTDMHTRSDAHNVRDRPDKKMHSRITGESVITFSNANLQTENEIIDQISDWQKAFSNELVTIFMIIINHEYDRK